MKMRWDKSMLVKVLVTPLNDNYCGCISFLENLYLFSIDELNCFLYKKICVAEDNNILLFYKENVLQTKFHVRIQFVNG